MLFRPRQKQTRLQLSRQPQNKLKPKLSSSLTAKTQQEAIPIRVREAPAGAIAPGQCPPALLPSVALGRLAQVVRQVDQARRAAVAVPLVDPPVVGLTPLLAQTFAGSVTPAEKTPSRAHNAGLADTTYLSTPPLK